jgi:hypothetical protein
LKAIALPYLPNRGEATIDFQLLASITCARVPGGLPKNFVGFERIHAICSKQDLLESQRKGMPGFARGLSRSDITFNFYD